ncbi:MAG: DUF5995 family protein [Ginsengibacter sp.]
MNQATTIAEVISKLDDIIAWSILHNSRLGYFATLYRQMTVAIQQGIDHDLFEDGKRMEKLDVCFANRYFVAWEAYKNKQPCTDAWFAVFDACENADLIVFQHLILGISTHINLDLCIATAEISPGDKIFDLKNDFNKINDLIAEQAQLVQNTLSKIWFPLRYLNQISGGREKAVLNFSIDTARKASWANAVALAHADDFLKNRLVIQIENMVIELSKKVIHPGFWLGFILKPVRMMESKNVGNIIRLLKE